MLNTTRGERTVSRTQLIVGIPRFAQILRARRSNGSGCTANSHLDGLPFGISGHATKTVFTPILEDQCDGFDQTFACLILCGPLAAGAWAFRATGDDELAIALEDRGELALRIGTPDPADDTQATRESNRQGRLALSSQAGFEPAAEGCAALRGDRQSEYGGHCRE